MTYEIVLPSDIKPASEVELVHDNPKSARESLDDLRFTFARTEFRVLRDGVAISSDELDADIESFEIASVREEECRLPSTYRRGWSNTTDEIAEGPDGNPTKVWDPENPEDRFDQPRRPRPKD